MVIPHAPQVTTPCMFADIYNAVGVGEGNEGGDNHIFDFAEFQGKLYFRANDGINGPMLWRYNKD